MARKYRLTTGGCLSIHLPPRCPSKLLMTTRNAVAVVMEGGVQARRRKALAVDIVGAAHRRMVLVENIVVAARHRTTFEISLYVRRLSTAALIATDLFTWGVMALPLRGLT